MKIIVQCMPDAAEKAIYDIDDSDFIVDVDTYGHFLNEVFLPEIKGYIENNHKIRLKDTKTVAPAEGVKNMYDNQHFYAKYWLSFDKIRDRFHLHKGDIYTYEFIGFSNVGHVIQIYKYEMPDLRNLLNKLGRRRTLSRSILKLLT